MASWSRVTIVGDQRRVDAVLPAQEPLGALMPDVLQLVGDPVESPPRVRHLVTTTGDVLDGDATLAGRRIPDGSVLRLIRADEPPPGLVVHDVPEAVHDALDDHTWRWGPGPMRWTATLSAMALTLVTGTLVRESRPEAGGLAIVSVAALLLLVTGLAIGAGRREPLGTALSLCGAGLAALAVWFAADLYTWEHWARWGGLAASAALVTALLGLVSPPRRGMAIGGVIALVLTLTWTAGVALGMSEAGVSAVLAIASATVLSLLPRVALRFSGLRSLDDRRTGGAGVTRGDVSAAVARAHGSMVVATVAVAIAAAVAGHIPVTRFNGWTVALAVLLAIVVAGRARVFPLAIERISLFGSAISVVAGLAWAWADHGPWAATPAIAGLLLVMLLPIAVLSAERPDRPERSERPEHLRARLRRVTDRVEAAAAIGLVPVAIGAFGAYERLLSAF